MFDKLIHPADISKDKLHKLYRDASMDASVDADGDLFVHEHYKAWIYAAKDGRDIRLASYFIVNPLASQEAKLEYANTVNDQLNLIRAYVRSNGGIGFDYYVYVDGGITRDTLIRATRRYFACLESAIKKDEHDVIGTTPNPWSP